MANHDKTEAVDFINSLGEDDLIKIDENNRVWIDNGGGSSNDFIELSVEELVDIVRKALMVF